MTTTPRLVAVGAAVLLLGVGLVPVTAAQEPLIGVSLGFAYEEDFDENDGDWTASEPPEEPERPDPTGAWEWGEPTSGPDEASVGTNLWATDLDGEYDDLECAALMTQTLDLTDADSASVTFDHWHEMWASTTGYAYAAAVLFVTPDQGETFEVVEPEDGYDMPPTTSTTKDCLDGLEDSDVFGGESDGWRTSTVDLTDHTGDEINLVFAFAGGSSGLPKGDGWYIDHVRTTIDGDTTVEDFEDDGGYSTVSTHLPSDDIPRSWDHDEVGGDTGPSHDSPLWATNTQGDYGPLECATLESVPFVVEDETTEGDAATHATLSWLHWYKGSQLRTGGLIEVGTEDGYEPIEPFEGYDREAHANIAHCIEGEDVIAGHHQDPGDAMAEKRADLSPYIGEEITLRFTFASADSTYTHGGWYIDEIAVELQAGVDDPLEHLDVPLE